ncbi:MAG: type 1 glutamine amidotransferase [Candidatus Aminicenantes bacterium]|nr:type 1 glutamine amidotransferase [Candidatus Aminicenantes bacterium]
MAPYLATNPAGNGGSLSAESTAGKRRFNSSRVLILQNCSTEGIGLYETRLQELGIVHHTLHPYAGESFPPLDRYNAIIVGGTPVSVNQIGSHHFLLKEGRFLKRALNRGKHILGICFGAQLLARLLGAVVTRNPVMEIGAYPVRLTSAGRNDPLFKGFPQTFPVFHWHGDTFAIPAQGRRLAMDRDCPNQAFRLGRAVGLQFHLEITPAEAKHWAGAYKDELGSVGKNAPQLASECRTHKAMMASLAGLLLDNFLAGDRH